jgi:methionyl-tRNA synthetase
MTPFYITTAIIYTNASPHIGHLLELLYTDTLARYWRAQGRPVHFLTGTDEHGQKISRKAAELGMAPMELATSVANEVKVLAAQAGVAFDDFIRTTDARHKAGVAAFWAKAMENGFLYKKQYRGLYCVGCESFKTEKDLVEGLCPDHLKAPETLEEENYFFRLSAFQKPLEEHFASHPDFVVPSTRFNEMRHILASGLEDISVSRSRALLEWGIPIPGDDTQVVYVWFDALVNYLSAIGYGAGDAWKAWWPAAVHVVGKEINRFHSLLWPSMLMAAGVALPEQIAVHGWITVDGQKMSKSLGNVLDPKEVLARAGAEPLRYFLLREIPFHGDGDFSWARFDARYSGDLANALGNLLNRALTLTVRATGGTLPALAPAPHDLTALLADAWSTYHRSMPLLQFTDALEAVWNVVHWMNKYADEQAPWKQLKTDTAAAIATLSVLLGGLRQVGWMLLPFMPQVARAILLGVGDGAAERVEANGCGAPGLEHMQAWNVVPAGGQLTVPPILFPRREE